MTRRPKHSTHTHANAPSETGRADGTDTKVGEPVFAQPVFTADPTKFSVPHPSDNQAYKAIDALNKAHKLFTLPFPAPRGLPEPVLTLQQVMGGDPELTKAIEAAGQLVFHSVGDTGSVKGPATQSLVADKMVSDYDEQDKANVPRFLFHLGDVIYNFGQSAYYYDQFYDPYREYPAPIVALAGNHDGMVAPGVNTPSLQAFLDNFCQAGFVITPEAGGLSRTAQIQPGVFFTFEAPFVRIFALYSGTLEDPGVISDADIGNSQIAFLTAALTRAKAEKFTGALIIAHHHPAYAGGSQHGGSPAMLSQIDAVCDKVGLWPHAVLSAHAHNYQRFTRYHGKTQIPYLVVGNGGHGLATIASKAGPVLRVPVTVQAAGKGADRVDFESYDDQDYGYTRIVANAASLRIEYHPASDGAAAKTPDDTVTVDLASRTIS
jgi:hypothetical protein